MGNDSWSKQDSFSAQKFSVIDTTSTHQVVFQLPGVRGFRIFLYVPGQYCVASAANRNVERRPGMSGVEQAIGKADFFDKTLGLDHGVYAAGFLTAPTRVPILFNLQWKFVPPHLLDRCFPMILLR
jgi:hypothetical protein